MKTLLIILISTGLRTGGVNVETQYFETPQECQLVASTIKDMSMSGRHFVETRCIIVERSSD